MSIEIFRKTKNSLGWVLFSISLVLLLWITFKLTSDVRGYGFDYGIMQDALFPAVSFLILSAFASLFIRSFLILGYSFCLSSSCLFLVITSGFIYGRIDDFPLKLFMDVLPLIISQILLNILGAFFLRLANYLEWKWWLKAFLPCTLLTILIVSLIFIPGLICIIIITWLWYTGFMQLHFETSRNLKLRNYFRLLVSVVFIVNFFISIKTYIFLKRLQGALITVDRNITLAFAPQIRWTIVSIILSLLSLIILFSLIKKTKYKEMTA